MGGNLDTLIINLANKIVTKNNLITFYSKNRIRFTRDQPHWFLSNFPCSIFCQSSHLLEAILFIRFQAVFC